MVRRRTAVSITAAALLAASPALTACGSGPAHPGAAATVGDQKISVATLQADVNELRSAAGTSAQGRQLLDSAGNLPQKLLDRLVQDHVLARAMTDAHVTVSDSEVQQEHQAALGQFNGSEAQLDSTLLTQYGVAPTDIDHFFYRSVASGKLIQSLGLQPGSDGGNAALTQTLAKTAKTLDVRINPRYGTWDAKQATIGAHTDPWVVTKTQAEAAAPTADGAGS